MNALDSSLEALAFNYLSYGLLTVANNIWTLVAVLAAAVSFWRMRASSELPRGKCPHGSSQSTLILEAAGHASTSSAEPEKTISSFKTLLFCALDREGGTKGKFTLYYNDEKCGSDYEGEIIDDNNNNNNNNSEWWSRWEMVMKIKDGDDEWYRFQDLMMINGNVVRLWDHRNHL